MIKVKNVTKYYGSVRALNNISFSVEAGEVVGFLGPNAAGKTTTMRILTGYLGPTKGDAEVCGFSILKDPLEVKKRVGYLPENNPLYDDMTVYEYLELVADFRGYEGKRKSKRMKEVIDICKLGDVIGRSIGEISRGFKQRTGFAAAIFHDPDVLILDEPTSGLDPNQTREVRELVKSFKKEKTLIISTHILPEVQVMCDRMIIINKGEIVAQGTTQELQSLVKGREKLYLQIKASQEEFERELNKIEGVQSYELRGKLDEDILEYSIEFAKDRREEMFNLAVGKGWKILEMYRERVSLEYIFRELTTEG